MNVCVCDRPTNKQGDSRSRMVMTNLCSVEDTIFSSIYQKPEGDLQGGQIAVDHLMSNLRVPYLNLRTLHIWTLCVQYLNSIFELVQYLNLRTFVIWLLNNNISVCFFYLCFVMCVCAFVCLSVLIHIWMRKVFNSGQRRLKMLRLHHNNITDVLPKVCPKKSIVNFEV